MARGSRWWGSPGRDPRPHTPPALSAVRASVFLVSSRCACTASWSLTRKAWRWVLASTVWSDGQAARDVRPRWKSQRTQQDSGQNASPEDTHTETGRGVPSIVTVHASVTKLSGQEPGAQRRPGPRPPPPPSLHRSCSGLPGHEGEGGRTAPHPIGTRTHLYCDWSLPPTSGDLSFCSKIRIILTKRTKLTCTERDRTSGQDPLPGGRGGSSKGRSSRHCRSKRPGPALPGSAPGRSWTVCVSPSCTL